MQIFERWLWKCNINGFSKKIMKYFSHGAHGPLYEIKIRINLLGYRIISLSQNLGFSMIFHRCNFSELFATFSNIQHPFSFINSVSKIQKKFSRCRLIRTSQLTTSTYQFIQLILLLIIAENGSISFLSCSRYLWFSNLGWNFENFCTSTCQYCKFDLLKPPKIMEKVKKNANGLEDIIMVTLRKLYKFLKFKPFPRNPIPNNFLVIWIWQIFGFWQNLDENKNFGKI